jgi:TM2 domain-containing membrane protein YozV
MYCKHCGKQVEDNAELCVHCGRRLRSSFASFLDSSEFTQLRPQATVKSPGLAGFLGFILGWVFIGPAGYLYLGQWNWFWITIVISLLAYPLTGIIGAYVVFPFIFAFHQYQMAKDLNALLEKNRARNSVDATEDFDSNTGPHQTG